MQCILLTEFDRIRSRVAPPLSQIFRRFDDFKFLWVRFRSSRCGTGSPSPVVVLAFPYAQLSAGTADGVGHRLYADMHFFLKVYGQASQPVFWGDNALVVLLIAICVSGV